VKAAPASRLAKDGAILLRHSHVIGADEVEDLFRVVAGASLAGLRLGEAFAAGI